MLSLAKRFAIFEQSFMGLDFILKKGEDDSTQVVFDEVFNPACPDVSRIEQGFNNLSDEELHDLLLEESLLSYLPTDKVRMVNSKLEKLTNQEIASRFDPDELNENDIPKCLALRQLSWASLQLESYYRGL